MTSSKASAGPLVRKVRHYLASHQILFDGLVVAVSGGADSVALLKTLLTLRNSANPSPLVIAHLNHQLRGEQSDADEAFVRQLHADLVSAGYSRLELRSGRIDVVGKARMEGQNLEMTARQVRYSWLAQVAQELALPLVATGHTADDQAETLLHRLVRGTGLKGLRGIAIQRKLASGVEVVRPMLRVTRTEVLAFLESQGQAYRQDGSNFDQKFTRNRLRHELLPLLRKSYNPSIVTVLCQLAEQAEEAFGLEESLATDLLAKAERPRAGCLLVLDRSSLAAANRHLVRGAFRLLWIREGWPSGEMGFQEWDRLAGLTVGEAKVADFPGGIRAQSRDRVVQVEKLS